MNETINDLRHFASTSTKESNNMLPTIGFIYGLNLVSDDKN